MRAVFREDVVRLSILFDGVDDQMVYAMPASGGPDWTFGTLLVIVKQAVAGSWMSFIEGETTLAAIGHALGRHSSGTIYCSTNVLDQATAIGTGDAWMLVAATKATGSAIPTFHKIPLATGTRTSTAGTTSLNNGATIALGNVRLGGNDDFANIYYGVAAEFVGTVLTGAQLDTIAAAKTTQSILDLSPTWCVDDGTTSNRFANDLVGTVHRTSTVGTTTSTDDPSGWVYKGAAAKAPVFPRRAHRGLIMHGNRR